MQHVPEKKHAVLGPSGWDTWGNCPGSVPLGADLPNNSSFYARQGTAAHQLLEDCLLSELDAEDLIGREYEVEGECFTVDSDMAEAVDAALNYIRDTIQPERGDILMAEQSVPLQWLTGEEDAEGTSDVVGIVDGGKTLVVMDYKHGQGVKVWASEKLDEADAAAGHPPLPNGQMAMYALATLHKYGLLHDEVETVRLVVLQPRQDHIDEHELTVEALGDFGALVSEAAGRVEINRQIDLEGGELELVPTEKGCRFCKAKVRCPKMRELTSNSLAVTSKASDFENLTLPKQASSVVVDHEISAEKLAELMRASDLIEAYAKAIRAEAERRLLAGDQVPGYYLGVGRQGNRKWQDEEVALEELTKSGRLKVAEATEAKVISPTTAEKVLKSRPKIWSKIAPLITRSPGGPSVCRDGDKNPVYKIASSTGDFENLDAPSASGEGELLVDKMQRIANNARALSAADLMAD